MHTVSERLGHHLRDGFINLILALTVDQLIISSVSGLKLGSCNLDYFNSMCHRITRVELSTSHHIFICVLYILSSYLILNTNKIRIGYLAKGLKWMGADLEIAEIECILANLIFKVSFSTRLSLLQH